jgi:hypothetical protein
MQSEAKRIQVQIILSGDGCQALIAGSIDIMGYFGYIRAIEIARFRGVGPPAKVIIAGEETEDEDKG